MDLQALQQATRSEHLHARHEKAEKLHKLGLEYLKRARAQDFDRVLLRNAARCFAAAIENNRSNPQPYLQQAYLFLLAGNARRAVKYLQEVQRLAPEHPELPKLLNYAQRTGKTATRHPAGPAQAPAKPDLLKLGRLRAQLSVELEQVMQKAYRELQNLQPTWARPVWQGYLRLQAEYDGTYQSLCTRLDKLEPHIDISQVDKELQKLEISLNRLDDVCELSKDMVELHERIEAGKQVLRGHVEAYERQTLSAALLSQVLSEYAEICETLADDLDMLEGSGFNISALTPAYESLVHDYQQLDTWSQEGKLP